MPICFQEEEVLQAIDRYSIGVRPDAPYLPDNLEFIRQANGLDKLDQVKDIITQAEYLIMGLGDVYLSAPCAVPVNPKIV